MAQPIAAMAITIMVSAIPMVHGRHGPLLNRFGDGGGPRMQDHLQALDLAAVIIVRGFIALALDRMLNFSMSL